MLKIVHRKFANKVQKIVNKQLILVARKKVKPILMEAEKMTKKENLQLKLELLLLD